MVKILGGIFAGILVPDGFTAYDHQALTTWLKQKCVGHLLAYDLELRTSDFRLTFTCSLLPSAQ